MKKGFTLVELIIVVTIVMLLGTIAIGMYFNTVRNFTYFNSFKNIQSVFRQARSFAITNASLGNSAPERFGVFIKEDAENYNIFMFADNGIAFQYEVGTDIVYLSKNFLIPKSKFDLSIKEGRDEADGPLELPVAFYYEKINGDLKAFYSEIPTDPNATVSIEKSSSNFIDIYLKSLENMVLERHLVINQVSGLPEEYKTL